jgi:cardiolipin synthase
MQSTAFLVLAWIAIAWLALQVVLAIWRPGLRYKISAKGWERLDSPEFFCMLESLTDARISEKTSAEVFANGENFYDAELAAIRAARSNINLEAYILQPGTVAGRFREALTERARAGVQVNIVLDAVGAFRAKRHYFDELRQAGGKVGFYHPLTLKNLPSMNNRTHRELLIVDGEVAFVGGAGIADHWLLPQGKKPRWRDTMVRVTGDAVPSLQASFAENWLEASGELISGEEYFPCPQADGVKAMVVNSTPSGGGSTRARILFQVLLASATKSIHITTPYFLPDISARQELLRAIKRGVEVTILTPGKRSDHMLTHTSSRRLYGEMLKAGGHIFEYQPGMIHAKVLLVDGLWAVVGSTNFDNRSFGINDEVNLAVIHEDVAARLESDFRHDLAESKEITYEQWRKRGLFERLNEAAGFVFQRQE